MNGGSAIGIRAENASTAAPNEDVLQYLDGDFSIDNPESGSSLRTSALPAILIVVPLAWVGTLALLARGELTVSEPIELALFVAALCVVPVLAGVVWLLTMRTSTAEARRFGNTARAMRAEAVGLERTVAVLGAAIEANRAALAEQIRTLSSLGDAATARLASIGRGLSEEIDQADVHARSLADAAETAQRHLAVLLAAMPRAHSETEALGTLLDRTGLQASEHVAALDAQLVALAERGRESEVVAGGAAQKLAAHLNRMEATSETAGARLEEVTGTMSNAVDALLDRTAQAVDEARKGIGAQGEAMLAMVRTNQAALGSAARESAEALAQRIEVVELVIDRVATRLAQQRDAGDGMVASLESGIDRVEGRFDRLHGEGTTRVQALAASISALGSTADAMAESLRDGDAVAGRAIGTVETLLIALDSAAREMDETLPDALARLDARLAESRSTVAATRPDLLALVAASESTHEAVAAVAALVAEQRRDAEAVAGALSDAIGAGRERVDGLDRSIEDAVLRANRFADEAAPRLVEAMLRVRETATAAADRARETLATVIPEAASALEAAGATALRRAASETIEAQIASVAQVAEAAVAAAGRATDRLEAQVMLIGEANATLDARIEQAREEQQADTRDSFARRASLLIEALNSASIDLTRSLSPEIADSAWAAYLKGDRSVFTRRAVRLLDGAEQREVARFYDEDAGFRDQVNRYIHDFEAMLRTILAQNEGSPLGITLLSSDMGKLYVALAQAIERLR